MWSEAIKILKGEYAVRAIKEHKMDQAIIFCRTKIDCDNLEEYFIRQGGGEPSARSGFKSRYLNVPSGLDANIWLAWRFVKLFPTGPDKKGHQLSCVCLHGDRKPNERKYNLERFKVKCEKYSKINRVACLIIIVTCIFVVFALETGSEVSDLYRCGC